MAAYISALPHMFGRDVNPYVIHQRVWEAFPGHDKGSRTPFLFAIQEEDGQVYVRSQVAPQWHTEGVRTKQERTSYPDGSILVLEVLLNPVKRGRREFALLDQDDVVVFAQRLLNRNGVQVLMDEDGFGNEEPQLFLQRLSGKPVERENKRPVPMNMWRCTAVVQITDTKEFERALVEGVGRKKAFGSGMILVRERRSAVG